VAKSHDDAEQRAEVRKHNAGRIVHVTWRTTPLMIASADALAAFAASAAHATELALELFGDAKSSVEKLITAVKAA
jgi:hypothetical protein